VRRAVSFLLCFVLLEGLWVVLVGTRQITEVVAGLLVAALGAALVELLRSLGLLPYETDPRLLARVWRLPVNVVFDFCVVTWVLARSLARRQRVRGEWVRVPFPTEGGGVGRWQRAFGGVAGNTFPNAIVVDLDGEEALLHALDRRRYTARSVL
jgi:hypothetical protein